MKLYFLAITFIFLNFFSSKCQDIFDACRKGDVESIKTMIKLNPDTVNSRNDSGFTPLIVACYRNQTDVVKLLLKHNAEVDAKSGEGTALMGICYKGNIELATLLLKHKADVNITNDLGTTPLMYSILGQNIDLIKLLIDHGAKLDVKERSGKTAFDYAIQTDNQEIINLLKKNQ